MGFNTALMICNDGLDQLRRDPQAAEKIYMGVLTAGRRDGNYISLGNHCNPVSILPSQHADVDQLVLVGGNTIRPVQSFYHFVGGAGEPLAEQVFHALARELGYTFRKKAWRKVRDAAQGIDARSGATGTGAIGEADESPVATGDAPSFNPPQPSEEERR